MRAARSTRWTSACIIKDKKREGHDGRAAARLEAWAARAYVEYIDRLSVDELVRLYNSVQILVSPSLYEGFGLPAAEAMACGTAVIATTAGAFPEFIEDGRDGRPGAARRS